MKAIVLHLGESIGSPEGHQAVPFRMYGRELSEKLGLECVMRRAMTLDDAEREAAENPSDLTFLMVSWRLPAEEVAEACGRIAGRNPSGKLIFLDYYAPTCSPHFNVLPSVDLYVKRQVLRDRSRYLEADYRGGFILTDYLAEHMGVELDDWHFGSRPDPSHLVKVVPGWNLGIVPKYRKLLRLPTIPWALRPIAVNRRIGLDLSNAKLEWYQQYRAIGLDRLSPLGRRHRLSGTARVSPRRYLAELCLSQIVFSPFGWGEVCFRDYEAVAAGALLVKPDMGHLETSPDIYVAGETYVPVRWDYSDLAETIEHYLTHPSEAKRIISNARRVLGDYYELGGFCGDIKKIVGAVHSSGIRSSDGASR